MHGVGVILDGVGRGRRLRALALVSITCDIYSCGILRLPRYLSIFLTHFGRKLG